MSPCFYIANMQQKHYIWMLTLVKLFCISLRNNNTGQSNMSAEKLTKLNLQIESMIQSLEQTKSENVFLRNKMAKLVQERADLVEKKNKAMNALKRIVKQLKTFREYQEAEEM